MLIDNVIIEVKAGDGGNGAATFSRSSLTAKGGPDGGNGGNGGDIFFQGTTNVNDLRYFQHKKKVVGENGEHGKNHNGSGKNAESITIPVPLGTTVTDMETGRVIEIKEATHPVKIARGGKGGFGNVRFKTSTNQAPKERELGTLGERKQLKVEIRLIAEIGLIGLPNAGKSSLLAAITRATPAIGAYPFTTLEPNIGMLGRHPIADIPGLIEGASQGVGLGIKFLKHIEKTKILVHCIDGSGENPFGVYMTVRNEFASFNPALLEKPEMIFLNKTDLLTESEITEKRIALEKTGKEVFVGSVHNAEDMDRLQARLLTLLTEHSS